MSETGSIRDDVQIPITGKEDATGSVQRRTDMSMNPDTYIPKTFMFGERGKGKVTVVKKDTGSG